MSMKKQFIGLATALATLLSGCSGSSSPEGTQGMLTRLGKGEGALNIVTWEGYAEDAWVKPFEEASGCRVNRKYAGSSDEMVALFRQGGNQYDLAAASGDASLRFIMGKTVQPINLALIPASADFIPSLRSLANTTVKGVHYGVPYLWGPNLLMWDKRAVSEAPRSWSILYDKAYSGRITVPDNPMQIADAALYLSKTKPELGITDPYGLTQTQLEAAVTLLKAQRPLIKKYWTLASDEVSLFASRDVAVGAAWPFQYLTLKKAGVPVESTIPQEGATGWVDSYMLAAKAPHPVCAYKYMAWVSTPKVQAQQALFFGGTPVNAKACKEMDALEPGSCARYYLDKPDDYAKRLSFWRTPQKTCADGSPSCTDYTAWQQAWQRVKN
jgi:putative spermidine/putrescine transport system substrate-binding protein